MWCVTANLERGGRTPNLTSPRGRGNWHFYFMPGGTVLAERGPVVRAHAGACLGKDWAHLNREEAALGHPFFDFIPGTNCQNLVSDCLYQLLHIAENNNGHKESRGISVSASSYFNLY